MRYNGVRCCLMIPWWMSDLYKVGFGTGLPWDHPLSSREVPGTSDAPQDVGRSSTASSVSPHSRRAIWPSSRIHLFLTTTVLTRNNITCFTWKWIDLYKSLPHLDPTRIGLFYIEIYKFSPHLDPTRTGLFYIEMNWYIQILTPFGPH